MSDSNIPDQESQATSNLGGKRIRGRRSILGQQHRDASIRAIKESWGVSEFANIFPENIRPRGDLGDSAISNLRAISKKIPTLGAARALMITECVDATGRPCILSFKNTANILNQVKATEQMVKDEEAAQKSKVLNPDKKKKLEEGATKEKIHGKPPIPSFSKEPFRPAHGPALKSGLTSGPTPLSSKESAAGKATEKLKVTPAKKTVPDKTKAVTPASKIGIVLDTPAMAKVRQRRETAVGLHAPSLQDVAPFGKALAIAKGIASKKAATMEATSEKATSNKVLAKAPNFKEAAVSEKASSKEENIHILTPKKAASKKATPEEVTPKETLIKKVISKKKSTTKKTSTRKGIAETDYLFEEDDELFDNATIRGFGIELEDFHGTGLRRQGLMTDENGIPVDTGKSRSRIPSKRPSEDTEALSYGGLTFSKESVMTELKFKKRVVRTPSEAETVIDTESVPGLLRDNIAHRFGFEEAAEAVAEKNRAAEAKAAPARTPVAKAFVSQTGGPQSAGSNTAATGATEDGAIGDENAKANQKVVEEKTPKGKVTDGHAINVAKSAKEKTTKGKADEKKSENTKASHNQNTEKKSDKSKESHRAIEKGSKKRKLVASDDETDMQTDVQDKVQVDKAVEKRKILKPVGIHPKLDVPFTTHFDKPSKDVASLWRDREEARARALAAIPQTPTSPIDLDPPMRETQVFNPARSSCEIQDFRHSRNTDTLSPAGKEHTGPKLSKDHLAPSTNLTSKTERKSTVPAKNFTMERFIGDVFDRRAEQSALSALVESKKDILDYSFSELVELSRAKVAMSTKAGKHGAMGLKDPMDYTIRELRDCLEEVPAKLSRGEVPAKDLAGKILTPAKALPMLPETLVARVHADRVLITSVPGIIKAYVEELRAIVADGKGPDGDLLSMIIVNKYGYFLEHVEKLDKELVSLYYEALERNP